MAKKKIKAGWVKGVVARMEKGGLHKSLGIPEDEKIPPSKIAAAAKRPGKVGKQARLALAFAKMRKGKKKK